MDAWIPLSENMLCEKYRILVNDGYNIFCRVREYSENPAKHKLTGCVMARRSDDVKIMHDDHLRRTALGDPRFLRHVKLTFDNMRAAGTQK